MLESITQTEKVQKKNTGVTDTKIILATAGAAIVVKIFRNFKIF